MGLSARRTGVALLRIRFPQRVSKALLAEDRSTVFRYGVVTAVVLATTCSRWALNPILGPHAPYLPFALAVMFAARIGGRGPGFAATALSTLSALWFFIEQQSTLSLWNSGAVAGLALFMLVGVLISLMVGHLRQSLLDTARAEDFLLRKTQLVDLSHDAIITADSSRLITSWNTGAEEDLWMDGKRSPGQDHPRCSGHHGRDFDRRDR